MVIPHLALREAVVKPGQGAYSHESWLCYWLSGVAWAAAGPYVEDPIALPVSQSWEQYISSYMESSYTRAWHIVGAH